ncbi:MAG: hypothetical protein WB502_07070 [Thermoactinomyces sp.]
MKEGETWAGRNGTLYEGVKATIDRITARKVSVSYDLPVHTGGLQVFGQVCSKGSFSKCLNRYSNRKKAICPE